MTDECNHPITLYGNEQFDDSEGWTRNKEIVYCPKCGKSWDRY